MASTPTRRLLGLTLDGKLIVEPHANASSIVYAAMGGGKTTCVAMPAIQSHLADHDQALIVNDVKNGEIAAQIADMCVKHGRKFAVVDDFKVLGANYPYRIALNPFGAAQVALADQSADLPFVLESSTLALIEEPANDQRNFYWRESPRSFLETAQNILLRHTPRLATPGGLTSLLASPSMWTNALVAEMDDVESPHGDAAAQLLDMKSMNPDHYHQHLRAALSALRIFSCAPLNDAGCKAEFTHERLLKEKWVVCFVNPIRHADRLGAYFAQHFLSIMQAQLSGSIGRTCIILDEYCNAPLRELVERITVFRAFQLRCIYITQSRADSVRKYGDRQTAVLEENCAVKQWLKFSDFEEAERVSRAMGDITNVTRSLNLHSDNTNFSSSLSVGKDRLLTAAELMSLPEDQQILHVANIGFMRARKIRQNEIAPYCFELADNPLEGGRLPPDPKVRLPTHTGKRP